MYDDDLVSVCMPIYNGASHLFSSVRSILNQTHRNLELLVVDDGSTDSTLERLATINDPRLRVIENDRNAGNIARRNQAFEICRGDYIAIMDADDVCSPDRLVRQIACLKNGFELCGTAVSQGRTTAWPDQIWRLPTHGPRLIRQAFFGSPLPNPSVMMTRALLDKSNFRFDADFFPAADYEAWARKIVLERVPTFVVPEPMVYRRQHGNQITSQKKQAMAEQADRVRKILFEPYGIPDKLVALHNKAIWAPLEKKELNALKPLYEQLLPAAMPDVFGTDPVYLRQNNLRIRPRTTANKKSGSLTKVSVIVPAFNIAHFLEECVSSVVEGCSDGIEVIIIDDGSTDDTPAICDKLVAKTPEKVRVIRQKNKGLSEARNAGIAASDAEYIYFLDGDDFVAKGAVDRLYKAAKENDADVVVSSHTAYFASTGETNTRLKVHSRELISENVFGLFTARKFGFPVINKFVRRSLAATMQFYPDIYHEDELYCPELFLKAKRVAMVPDELYFYRQREGSITAHITEKHINDWMFVAEQIFAFGLQHALDVREHRAFSLLMRHLFVAARRKLDDESDLAPGFVEDAKIRICQLEAQLTEILHVREPAAEPWDAESMAKTRQKAARTRQLGYHWQELMRLQKTLSALQTMDRSKPADASQSGRDSKAPLMRAVGSLFGKLTKRQVNTVLSPLSLKKSGADGAPVVVVNRRLDGFFLDGWIVAKPDLQPQLSLYIDGALFGKTTPTRKRPDIVKSYPETDGKLVGFRFEVPETLFDGKDHEFQVVENTSQVEARNSPLRVSGTDQRSALDARIDVLTGIIGQSIASNA